MAVAENFVKPRAKQKRMTEEEFMRLPRDGRKWELVEGRAQEVPTRIEHDVIVGNLVILLGPHVKGRGFVTLSQAGFRMTGGNLRLPDAGFTRKERLPDGKPIRAFPDFAPDLAVEIVSPSERPADIFQKLGEYFDAGAQIVWLVSPEARTVTVYLSPLDARTLSAEDELTAGDLLPGFVCRAVALFDYE